MSKPKNEAEPEKVTADKDLPVCDTIDWQGNKTLEGKPVHQKAEFVWGVE